VTTSTWEWRTSVTLDHMLPIGKVNVLVSGEYIQTDWLETKLVVHDRPDAETRHPALALAA